MKVGTDAMVLGALIETEGKQSGLDIGTGTGVLSLMVAQRNPNIKMQAIEIDHESAVEASQNFQNSPWSSRLSVIEHDFRAFDCLEKFDLIISNPPYFESGLLNESTRKAKTRHEESLPLIELFEKVSSLLTPEGCFWLILPYETAEKWKAIAQDFKLYCVREITINGKVNLPKRIIFCFSLQENTLFQNSLIIRKDDNSYTEEYKISTADFHGVEL